MVKFNGMSECENANFNNHRRIRELEQRLEEVEKYLHICLGAEGFNVDGKLDWISLGTPPWLTENKKR